MHFVLSTVHLPRYVEIVPHIYVVRVSRSENVVTVPWQDPPDCPIWGILVRGSGSGYYCQIIKGLEYGGQWMGQQLHN